MCTEWGEAFVAMAEVAWKEEGVVHNNVPCCKAN